MTRSALRNAGFTLIEMMITVAIIGVLASIAIPSFRGMQLRSERAEAFGNIEGIAKAEKSYFAEYGVYQPVLAPQPGGLLPGTGKRNWTAAAGLAFGSVGWVPEGAVFFDYDVNVDTGLCPSSDCFTASAYGNLDGNAFMSLVVYAQPSTVGVFAPSLGLPAFVMPPIDSTGRLMANEVAVHPSGDLY